VIAKAREIARKQRVKLHPHLAVGHVVPTISSFIQENGYFDPLRRTAARDDP
jgi:hypothetical protein